MYSTDSEWDRAEAWELGADNPTRAWVLTDRDVWHRNCHYTGPPVPHPEEYDPEEHEDGRQGQVGAHNDQRPLPDLRETEDDYPF